MPTFFSTADHAAEAAEHLRQLAGPDAVYSDNAAIIHDLQETVTSMAQVVDRLSGAYFGSHVPAHLSADGQAATDELHQAGTALEAASTWLAGAGRVAERMDTATDEPAQTWIPVVNLEGKDSTIALGLLDTEGPEAAAVFLSQWDEGTETDNEAMVQRLSRDRLPIEPGDQAASFDAYTIIANQTTKHIAMYRLHDDEPNIGGIALGERFTPEAPTPAATPAAREQAETTQVQKSSPARSWFDPPTTGGTGQGRGRSL